MKSPKWKMQYSIHTGRIQSWIITKTNMEEIMNLALKDEREATKRDITNIIREAQRIANEE